MIDASLVSPPAPEVESIPQPSTTLSTPNYSYPNDPIVLSPPVSASPTKYNLLIVDPPWTYPKSGSTTNSRGLAKSHYELMTKDELINFPIQRFCLPDCYCFMWTTGTKMKESIELLESWGFEYFSIVFTWIKKNKIADSLFWGMGAVSRSNPEYVILGRQGKLERKSASVHSVIDTKISDHSVKPIELHKRIEELYGDLPRIELFATYHVPGWTAWGKGVDSTEIP